MIFFVDWIQSMDGRRYEIQAHLYAMGGNLAHADQIGLADSVVWLRRWPCEIRGVRGVSEQADSSRLLRVR